MAHSKKGWCRSCATFQVAGNAKCPECGIANPVPSRSSGLLSWVIAWGVILSLVGGAGYVGWSFIASFEEGDPGAGDVGAFTACQFFVRQELTAPSTARFASWTDTRIAPLPEDSTIWRMTSHVDAQNASGAQVRTRFRCEVHFDTIADRWVRDDVQFYQR